MSDQIRLSKEQFDSLTRPRMQIKSRRPAAKSTERPEITPSALGKDYLTLPSGAELFARGGFIAIDEHCQLSQGFSDNLDRADLKLVVDAKYFNAVNYWHLSPTDKVAIAEMMINRWRIYQSIAEEEGADD